MDASDGAISRGQASSAAGQIVGDAAHEMLSFKEIYLFVGQFLHAVWGSCLHDKLPVVHVLCPTVAACTALDCSRMHFSSPNSQPPLRQLDPHLPASELAGLCLTYARAHTYRRAGLPGRRGVPGGRRHLRPQHPHRGRLLQQILDPQRAVERGVLGVDVQVHEIASHAAWPTPPRSA